MTAGNERWAVDGSAGAPAGESLASVRAGAAGIEVFTTTTTFAIVQSRRRG
jgi:hypothetical protein